jgi:hypothetical protein
VPRGVVDSAVAERDRAGVGRLEAGETAKRRRLAAPAGAEEDQELAGFDLKVEVVDRDRRRLAGEALREARDAYAGQ